MRPHDQGVDRGRVIRIFGERAVGWIPIVLVVLLGLALLWTRLVHLDESLWHDEANSILNFNKPDVLIGSKTNHALFNFLSWATTQELGSSEPVQRIWSVVPAIAAVVIATCWAWRRIGVVAAIAFASLAVASPLHLSLAPQARGYGLALLAATLMLIAAERLTRTYSRPVMLGFLGSALMGIWTLIIFVPAFVGQAAALIRRPNLRPHAIAVVAIAVVLSAIFYEPIVSPYLSGGSPAADLLEAVGGSTTSLPQALVLQRSLEWIVVPIVALVGGDETINSVDDRLLVVVILAFAFAVAVTGLVGLWRRGEIDLALALVVPPLFFNLAFSLAGLTWVARFHMFLLTHVLLMVAVGVAELGGIVARVRALRPLAIAVGVVAVLALTRAAVEREEAEALPRENFKGAAAVATEAGISPIVTDSVRPEGLEYYLGDSLEELPASAIEQLLCSGQGLVYIRHLPLAPEDPDYVAPADVDCVVGRAVRVRVPQRDRGRWIDVWIVPRRGRGEGGRGDEASLR